jgi:hypothetical protein
VKQDQQTRPIDVDTGFWLWTAALPLMVIGYLVDVASTQDPKPTGIVYVISALFVLVVSTVVVAFLILMRSGYRWARTVLTGGAFATVIYVATSVFTHQRSATAAVVYAMLTIVGAVLILGGIFLLHRQEAQGYFTR